MDNKTYGRVLFILSHYTENVVKWLEEKMDKGFFRYVYNKLKDHHKMITPIIYYNQLVEMINKNTQQEGRIKEKVDELILFIMELYEKKRG